MSIVPKAQSNIPKHRIGTIANTEKLVERKRPKSTKSKWGRQTHVPKLGRVSKAGSFHFLRSETAKSKTE